jgi:hypothetical protein
MHRNNLIVFTHPGRIGARAFTVVFTAVTYSFGSAFKINVATVATVASAASAASTASAA